MNKPFLRLCPVILSIFITSSCSKTEDPQAEAIEMRHSYLSLSQATALCQVTADYGERVYDFSMVLVAERREEGLSTTLTLTEPASLKGISVTQTGTGQDSQLVWEDLVLETGDLNPEGLSPVTAIPLLLDTLERGFIHSVSLTEKHTAQGTQVLLELISKDPDAPTGTGQEVVLWVDAESYGLVGGEIFQDGRRVVACTIENFIMNVPQGG